MIPPDYSLSPNTTHNGKGFYVSHLSVGMAVADYGGETTALVDDALERFLILNGDHRKGYGPLIAKGYEACLAYFRENLASINKMSNALPGEARWETFSRKNPLSYLLAPIGQSRLIGAEREIFSNEKGFMAESLNPGPDGWRSQRYVILSKPSIGKPQPIGVIQVALDPGKKCRHLVQNIYVDELYRRNGVATRLCDFIMENGTLEHSESLTPEGRAFVTKHLQRLREVPAGRLGKIGKDFASEIDAAPEVIPMSPTHIR